MHLSSFFFIVLSLLIHAVAHSQQPIILYVNHADPACGGKAPCFTTIQSAVTAAQPGNIVRIQAGTYSEQVAISNKNNFAGSSELHRIVVEADPASVTGSVVIRPPAATCLNASGVSISRSRFVTLRGLTIKGAVGTGIVLLGGPQQNQSVHIHGNRIVSNGSPICPGGGIAIALGNPNTVIVNNLIHGNVGNGIILADISGGPHWLIQNTIHGNSWNGVAMVAGQTITLANNSITGNGIASGMLGGRHGVTRAGFPGQSPESVTLLNNLICGNRLGEVHGPVLDSTDAANLTPNGKEGPGVSASAGCDVPSNVYASVNGIDGIAHTADDDFRLSDISPAVDAGMDSRNLGLDPSFNLILEADYELDLIRPKIGKRGNAAQFDIGAHEYEFPNQPPVASAGQSIIVPSGTATNLDGTGSYDPDGDSITYDWTQSAGPSVTLSNSKSATPVLLAPQVQTPTGLKFELTVNDGLASDSASVNVTVVKPNQKPVLSPIGDKIVQIGKTLTFTISASDADGDPLIYSVSPLPLPANANFNANSGVFVFTPTSSQLGSFNLTFGVSDGRGGMASETISVTVTGLSIKISSPVNGAAVLSGPLIVTGTVANPGAGEIGAMVSGYPAGLQGTAFTALVFVSSEMTSLTALASDGNGNTASDTITISVSGPTSARPILHASPTSGAAPHNVMFSLIGDAPIAQVSLDANGDGIIDYSGPNLDQHPFTFSQPGIYVATASGFDAQGNQFAVHTVIQVHDASQLDGMLQAKWTTVKNALRDGNIAAALNDIASRSRDRYDEAFQIIAAQLPNIDQILTNIPLVRIGSFSAVYEGVRIDDGLEMSFEVRFALDGDGIWRLEAF